MKWKIVSGFDHCTAVCRHVRRVFGNVYNGVVYGKLEKYRVCGCIENDPAVTTAHPDMMIPLKKIFHIRYVSTQTSATLDVTQSGPWKV